MLPALALSSSRLQSKSVQTQVLAWPHLPPTLPSRWRTARPVLWATNVAVETHCKRTQHLTHRLLEPKKLASRCTTETWLRIILKSAEASVAPRATLDQDSDSAPSQPSTRTMFKQSLTKTKFSQETLVSVLHNWKIKVSSQFEYFFRNSQLFVSASRLQN